MRSIILFLAALWICAPALAAQPAFTPAVLEDVVLFESNQQLGQSSISLKGPGTFMTKLNFEAGAMPFIDINYVNGAALADGLYKYEITTAPVARWSLTAGSRGSGKTPSYSGDRNAFSGMTDPKNSPVSGTFRVVNGITVDPNLKEWLQQ